MSIDALQETTLGTWKSPPYQITLHTSEENLWAEAGDSTICFSGKQIKWGIIQTIPQQALIDKIRSLSPGEIAIFHYPKENPTELWVFEARPMVGTQIRQGKEYLIQAQNNPLLYEKALANFETALKLQKKVNGNTVELEQIISQIKNKIQELEFYQNALLYLPTDEEKEKFGENVELYKENICISFENLLSVEESFSPHHHLMSALVHEEKREFLLAIDDYLNLSENNPYALACFEKAYTLLDLAQPQDLLNIKESIRIAFEKRLRELGQQEKAPTCFICFNTSEKDVGEWLEKTLVPDLDLAGIKPIFCYKDLSQGQDLDNFHELGRNADLVIIACTPGLKTKYEERKKAPVGVAMEIKMIKGRYKDPDKVATIFPLYLKGRRKDSLPTAYFESVFGAKFSPFKPHSFEFNYFSSAFDLFSAMRSVSRDISRRAGEEFLADAKQILKGKYNVEEVTLWREEQTKRIQALRETIAHRISAHTQVINLPLPPKDFTGREKELTDLHEACRNGHRVAVTGLGGMGKTALALKYGENYKSHYQFIHFMPAGTPELAVDGLLRLADDLHIPKSKNVEERLQWLKTKLDRFEREYLLIFDGMDQIEVFHKVDKYLPERGRCLLLTSRMPEEAHIRGFAILNLKRLSIEEAVDYLLLVTGSQEKKEAEQLAEKLGCLPLALKHAAGYIHSIKGFTIQAYNDTWDTYELKLFEDERLSLKEEEKTILKTWKMSVESIENRHKCSFAKEVLGFFAFMGQVPIPMTLINRWREDIHSHISDLELHDALKLLCNYSMIDSSKLSTVEIHALVQKVTYYQMPAENSEQVFQQVVESVALQLKYKEEDISTWDHPISCMPHALGLFNMKNLIVKIDLQTQYEFMHVLADLYQIMGNTKQAVEIQKKCLEISEAWYAKNPNLDSSKQAIGQSHNDMGFFYRYLPDFDKALLFLNQGLVFRLKFLGENHPDVASSYNNIGEVYHVSGREREALSAYEQSVKVRLMSPSESSHRLATTYSNIGLIYKNRGNYDLAIHYYEEALEIRKKILGENHTDVAVSYNNIGLLCSNRGDYDKSIFHLEKALKIRLERFGKNHPMVATVYNNLGLTFKEKKEYPTALDNHHKAKKIRLKTLGSNHPDLSVTYGNIAETYICLNDFENALENAREASRIALYNNIPVFTADAYHTLGLVYKSKKKYLRALEFYQEALNIRIEKLGINHHSTAINYYNIGAVYSALGAYPNAFEALQKSLRIMFHIYKKGHPNLESALKDMIGLIPKISLFQIRALQEFVTPSNQVLGESHPLVQEFVRAIGS